MTGAGLTILIYSKDPTAYLPLLRARGVAAALVPCATPAEAAEHIERADILFAGPFPYELLPRARRLRWIQSLWAGVEGWVATPHYPAGVPLTRMAGIFGDWIAEYALAYLLLFSQQVPRIWRQQQARHWEPFTVSKLAGRTLGVAGLGTIGQAVARRGHAFGLAVRGLSRSGAPVAPCREVYPAPAVDEFCQGLDALVVTLPHTPDTRRLFGAPQFGGMNRGAVVVNVGRGQVLDERALAAALRAGHLGGAALDVFAKEPLPADDPLWAVPNLVISPHLSGPTTAAEAVGVCVANLERFLAGEPLLYPVDRARGY